MKKTAAVLLIAGLVNMQAVYAQEKGGRISRWATNPPPLAGRAKAAEKTAEKAQGAAQAPAPASAATSVSPRASASPSPAAPSEQIDLKNIRSGKDFVTLNFTNIDIGALIKVMSELTRRNFILDERVAGKITIMTPTRVSPEEAYQVFLTALEIKGFTAVEDGKIVRIIPTSAARQSGLKVYQDVEVKGEGFVTKLIRLNYVTPQEVVRTMVPLITKDGSMIAYPATNSVIVTDAVSNMKKLESLIRAIDVEAPEGKGKINVYYLKHANSEDVAKLMAALVSRIPAAPAGGAAQPAGPSTILGGAVTITSDKATNALIIVASPDDYETVKGVIQKIDIRRRQVYVEAAIIEMSLAKSREIGIELQAPIKSSSLVENSSSITPVGGTNFGNIANVIANGPQAFASMSGLAVGAVKGTFKFQGRDFLSVGALLHALQTDGDVNVLSTPNILTMDNQKARIMVGENVPFVGSTTLTAATGGNPTFNIERKDVGITLELTPQITSDDNVRLEVKQEISNVIQTSGLNANQVGPSTSKRSADTTVVVKDRQTMVIGGLIRDNVTSATSKVPFLGDIPILGWLFKSKTTRVEKTNLMIFITPYIIKNEDEAGELTNKKTEMLEEFRKEYRIEKKKGSPGAQPVAPEGESGSVETPAEEEKPADEPAEHPVQAPFLIPEGEEMQQRELPPGAEPPQEQAPAGEQPVQEPPLSPGGEATPQQPAEPPASGQVPEPTPPGEGGEPPVTEPQTESPAPTGQPPAINETPSEGVQ